MRSFFDKPGSCFNRNWKVRIYFRWLWASLIRSFDSMQFFVTFQFDTAEQIYAELRKCVVKSWHNGSIVHISAENKNKSKPKTYGWTIECVTVTHSQSSSVTVLLCLNAAMRVALVLIAIYAIHLSVNELQRKW